MSFFSILSTLFIGPLKLLFEVIFELADRFVNHPGLSIIFLSLIMNILVLPLYKRADAMQEEARDTDMRLKRGVDHIKKTFSGDEKMMIMQAYYRQNNYKPTDALRGSVSLLLEIPFFMAAYQFLSNLASLEGVSLGPIADLSKPDGLLVLGGVAINLLPVIMTLINVISSAIYLRGFPLKTKIQLYGMALFFLVFLYTSPSGLVFYWTLNNLFSLVKTIFYKIKNPKKVLYVITSLLGAAFTVFSIFFYNTDHVRRRFFLLALGVVLMMPAVLAFIRSKQKKETREREYHPNKKLFAVGSIFLTVLVGLLIPATFIAASPQEYVDITYFFHPIWYVVSSLCFAIGTFLIWLRVFYWLANDKWKVVFERGVCVFCGVAFVNYMFFGTNLGIISSALQYTEGMAFTLKEQLINIGVLAVVASALIFCVIRWKKAAVSVLLVASIALSAMSAVHVFTINSSVAKVQLEQSDEMPNFTLSKTGKNVIVFMLDRGYGGYIPYIMNEKPELKEKFDGFTYYSNTISFGGFTNFGTPPLFGGYEYTPVEMNKRSDESLASKHNEALKLMPVLFDEEGYEVTVCDAPYANYEWIPDLSIFDEYPDIRTFLTEGKFKTPEMKQQPIDNNLRNFFCFGIMKSLPLFVQPTVYNDGVYNRSMTAGDSDYTSQTVYTPSTASGIGSYFMGLYNVLVNLPNITKVTREEKNTFLMIQNSTTHDPILLQEPEYEPAQKVDNTEYDAANTDRFTVDGRVMHMENEKQMKHYQTNMAALMKIGDWLDYMKEQGVYDNTKIIIAADHGGSLKHFDELHFDTNEYYFNEAEYYYPLLMVKDFGSHGFTTSEEFMTNADVPTLAFEGTVENPVNPFTGKAVNNDEKYAHDQFITVDSNWDVTVNNGNTFIAGKWASVKDNIWDKSNWTLHNHKCVLSEYSFDEK